MKVAVEWTPPMLFEGLAESQAQAVMASRRDGEVPAGPSPMETVLMGLCACAGMDVVEILEKMRAKLANLHIEANAERAAEPPRVFTKIHLRFRLWGAGLTRGQAERAVALSLEKYCSVAAMLRSTAQITSEVVVRPAEEDERPASPGPARPAARRPARSPRPPR
jgi:putative redox protein